MPRKAPFFYSHGGVNTYLIGKR